MAHGGLDLRQIELRVIAGRQFYVPVFLRKSLDDDALEVPLGDGFFHGDQPVAQAFRSRNLVVRIVRSHDSGRQCRLQCADGFVGDPEVIFAPVP